MRDGKIGYVTSERSPNGVLLEKKIIKVILAKSAGFCWGVKRAVEKARHIAAAGKGIVHTDGPLIHNKQMMEQLRSENVIETGDPASISEGTLVIRAHGIPPARLATLKELQATLVDATCPDVAKIQSQISDRVRRGYHILIFGDPGHAEVEGLLGYAAGKGFVVSNAGDVARLTDAGPFCLVSQSTQLPDAYARIAEAVRRRFSDAVVLDTICRATKNRQEELVRIAGEVDAIVVVGDPHSANTKRLVELGQTLKPTRYIQTSSQIRPDEMKKFKVVGLTAGASTPSFVLDEVKAALEQIKPDQLP